MGCRVCGKDTGKCKHTAQEWVDAGRKDGELPRLSIKIEIHEYPEGYQVRINDVETTTFQDINMRAETSKRVNWEKMWLWLKERTGGQVREDIVASFGRLTVSNIPPTKEDR